MNILLVDDDPIYCLLLCDHFSGTPHILVPVDNQTTLYRMRLPDFSVIIMDHTLSWATGSEEIDRMSNLCELDFALISTYKDSIFLDKNTKNRRITGIFGKYEFDELDSWVQWSKEKQIVLNEEFG